DAATRGGERQVLPADGPGDRSACLAEQRSRLAEQRSLACRRRAVGLDDQGARPDEEPLDGGRQRLPVTRTLVEIPVERAEDGRGGLERVRRAVVGDTVAALGHVTVAGYRPADRRALLVGGARGARIRARLRDVTHAGGGPALEAGGLQDVGRAAVAHPVAQLRDVAAAGRRPADPGVLAVGGAACVTAGARLGRVARPGCRPAPRRRGLERGGRARAVAARTELGLVAWADGPAAFERRGLEPIGGAAAARAGAEFRHVAGTRGRAAERG